MRRMTSGEISPRSRRETMASLSAASSSRRQFRQAAELSVYSCVEPPSWKPLEPLEGGMCSLEPGLQLRQFVCFFVSLQPEPPYQGTQREPLQDQREEDRREGE